MEHDEASLDTQAEVDLLILDYLVCTAINSFICTQQKEEQGQTQVQSAGWLLWTANNLVPSLAHRNNVPQDITIKLKVLDFINICCQNTPQNQSAIKRDLVTERGPESSRIIASCECIFNTNGSKTQYDASPGQAQLCRSLHDIATNFLSLCIAADGLIDETGWADIAAQLMLKAALEQHQKCEDSQTKIFHEQIEQMPDFVKRTPGWGQVADKYNAYICPPSGISMPHIEIISERVRLEQLGDAIINFLITLMNKICPPILLQLEKGKLRGLSRTETRELKYKAGLR